MKKVILVVQFLYISTFCMDSENDAQSLMASFLLMKYQVDPKKDQKSSELQNNKHADDEAALKLSALKAMTTKNENPGEVPLPEQSESVQNPALDTQNGKKIQYSWCLLT